MFLRKDIIKMAHRHQFHQLFYIFEGASVNNSFDDTNSGFIIS